MILTVFTPTYNRANTLRRTFKSLLKQNFKDFEWLIIDDGSTDETASIAATFNDEAYFPVRYYYQEHGGKHRAYNKALELAAGDYFFTVDSDDWLTVNSLEDIAHNLCANKEFDSVCGLMALKENVKGMIYGSRFPKSPMLTTLLQLEKLKCFGERSLVFKTQIARMYPFPTIENETFATECLIYDRIGRDWPFLAVNSSLTVCEYQSDGLTENIYNLMWNNPVGFMIYHAQRIEQAPGITSAIQHTLRYHAFRVISKDAKANSHSYLGRYRIIVNLLAPIGWLGKIYYKLHCK